MDSTFEEEHLFFYHTLNGEQASITMPFQSEELTKKEASYLSKVTGYPLLYFLVVPPHVEVSTDNIRLWVDRMIVHNKHDHVITSQLITFLQAWDRVVITNIYTEVYNICITIEASESISFPLSSFYHTGIANLWFREMIKGISKDIRVEYLDGTVNIKYASRCLNEVEKLFTLITTGVFYSYPLHLHLEDVLPLKWYKCVLTSKTYTLGILPSNKFGDLLLIEIEKLL